MKKTLGMVFFLTVLAGMAGCGQKNTANTTEQTDTQTEKTLEEHFFSAEQELQPAYPYNKLCFRLFPWIKG